MQRKDKNKNWVAVSALIVSILSFGYTIYSNYIQNKRIQDITFNTQGFQNRPILRVVGEPEVRKIEYKTTVGLLDNKIIETKLKNDTKIRIRNDGNSNAQVLFYAVTDRLSGIPEMREIIFNKEQFKKFSVELTNDYYKMIDILPGGEHTFEVSRPVENVKEGSFNIHYFFLYKNEGENIYDTYYWVRFLSKQFTINPRADDAVNKKAVRDSIVFIDDHQSYKIYSKEASLYLRNMHKSLQDGFAK